MAYAVGLLWRGIPYGHRLEDPFGPDPEDVNFGASSLAPPSRRIEPRAEGNQRWWLRSFRDSNDVLRLSERLKSQTEFLYSCSTAPLFGNRLGKNARMVLSTTDVYASSIEPSWRRILPVLLFFAVCACKERDPIVDLARMSFPRRPVEARLCGGFRWAPVDDYTPKRRRELSSDGIRRSQLKQRRGVSPSARHANALADLLEQRPEHAVTTLAALAAERAEPSIWNDLAAARYATAVANDRPEELAQALADVDISLRLDKDLPEARFNRALILERLGVRKPAIAAWSAFLEVDGVSEWSIEARSRLGKLEVEQTQFRDLFERDYDQLINDPGRARILTQRFRQDARIAAETEVLARWAEAMKKGDVAEASRHLALATAMGVELAANDRERIVEDAVTIIQASTGATRDALITGHLEFRAAQKVFRSGRPGESEPLFRHAIQNLTAGGSPVAYSARYFAAYVAYEQGKVKDSTRELEEVLAEVPAKYPTCRARITWQLAICRAAERRWGDLIEFAQASLDDFERAGETYNAAVMREHLAEGYDVIGDPASSWAYRSAALQEIGKRSTRLLQAMLGFLCQEALMRRDWAQARSFAAVELEVGSEARFQPLIADAHLRRARIMHHFGDGEAANEIARARLAIGAIPDAGMRLRLEARHVAVEAMVSASPIEAVPLLSKAIAFHSSPDGQRMFLPTLLFHRAGAQRSLGHDAAARQDLDAALDEFDAARGSLSSSGQRMGIFESADAIVDEAIDLALQQKDVKGAFAYADRARARTLLDELRARVSTLAQASLPENTAIVSYALAPSRSVIFVLDRSGIRVATRPMQRTDIQRRTMSFVESLSNDRPDARSIGQTLYRDLIEPIEPWIASTKALVIIPDATVGSMPFAALPARDGRFLVERHILLSAPSASMFLHGARNRDKITRSGPALIVVNRAGDAADLETLRATSDEAERIAAMYDSARTLADEEATRAAFVREVSHAAVVHFAGHGLSSEYRPEDTAIVLAGPNGRMSASDIAPLQLDGCSVVVLSACSTARGKVRRFEGALSVARAFLAAGAPHIVATLWPIGDEDAAAFFPRIHEHMVRGLSPPEALQAAQIESIRNSVSPSSWAAVHVIGR